MRGSVSVIPVHEASSRTCDGGSVSERQFPLPTNTRTCFWPIVLRLIASATDHDLEDGDHLQDRRKLVKYCTVDCCTTYARTLTVHVRIDATRYT
jgi:hypothetical protein